MFGKNKKKKKEVVNEVVEETTETTNTDEVVEETTEIGESNEGANEEVIEESSEKESKFVLDGKKPLLHEGKRVLKKYEEGKFTVYITEEGTTYKTIS